MLTRECTILAITLIYSLGLSPHERATEGQSHKLFLIAKRVQHEICIVLRMVNKNTLASDMKVQKISFNTMQPHKYSTFLSSKNEKLSHFYV
jgi:hypothetical protein